MSRKQLLFQAAALLIALAAAWPLLAEPGLLNTRGGGDSPFLLQRLHQLEVALHDGHFPVRWMPDANYGYGYPFFNYYAPLSIYIAAAFRFIGFSFVRAIHLAQLLGFLAAAWGMFHLGRRWFASEWAGLLAAAAYTLAPFHMVNVYVRGDSLAEFWAMAFYPLLLLAADGIVADYGWRPGRRVALFALAYAALILSHNISALIFSPFLLLYLLLLWGFGLRHKKRAGDNMEPVKAGSQPSPPLLTFLAFLLAFGLSAWFFLPALYEQSLAQLEPVTAGYFHFSNHFRSLDIFQTSFLFDYNVEGGNAFRMGLAQAVTAGLGLLVVGYRLVIQRHSLNVSAYLYTPLTLLIATFMITPLSRPLWEHLPLLPFTQFPWRFLSVQALATSLAIGGLALLPWRRLIVPGIILLLLASALGDLPTDHLVLVDADVTAERLAEYEWFTGNIGSTVSAEYLPYTVQPRPYTSLWLSQGERDKLRPLAGELLSARLIRRQASQQTWAIVAGNAGATLVFPTLYWPGWRAEVDGQTATPQPSPGSGLIRLELPPGEHVVRLRLARTPVRLVAELVSLAAILVAAWLLRPDQWPKPGRAWALALAAFVFLAIGLRLWPARALPSHDLTWDFAQMGYLHHDAGVSFDNGWQLQAYSYSSEAIAAGQPLTITVTWMADPATRQVESSLSLYLPAINRLRPDQPAAPVLAAQAQPLRPGAVAYEITLPANAPPGLYAPRLTLSDSQPLTPSGQERGDLFLRPLRVTAVERTAGDGPATLDVQAVRVQQRDSTALDVQLAWLTRQPLGHNYNLSLRLATADGRDFSQLDTQPGYGFLPSSGWPPGQWVDDWLALLLPETLPGASPYALLARLYEVDSGRVVLIRRLGEVNRQGEGLVFRPNQPVFTLPGSIEPLTAVFRDGGDVIQLHGYTLEQSGDTLNLTFYWEALVAGREDYTRFVHLIDPVVDGPPLLQNDGLPHHNSYPTSQWTAGEVVADPVTLDLSGVPPGEYQIVVGFYRAGEGYPRLESITVEGRPLPDGRVPLPVVVKGN